MPLTPPRGSTPPPLRIRCQTCGGPAPPAVGAAECDACHGERFVAGAQRRRAFCALRPDISPSRPDLLSQIDAHVAVSARYLVPAGRPIEHPLPRVPSDGSGSFERYEEEQNARHCALADSVGELNPPMEGYHEDCMWYMGGSGSHPGSPPAAFYSPPGFNSGPDVPSLPPSPPSDTVLQGQWCGVHDVAPVWGSAETADAALRIRDAPTDLALQSKRRRVMERAADSGLLGVHSRPLDVFTSQPSAYELYGLRELRAATTQVVHESVDPGRIQSAVSHWELMRQEMPSRTPFLPLTGPGSPGRDEAERYNAETFELFTASCLRRGSLRPGHLGQPLETDTIAGYVSALRALLSRDGGAQMRSAHFDVRIKALGRGIRQARGPRPSRKRRLGLRARHLRSAAAARGFDRVRTWTARRRWLAAVLGHSLVARGCELGRPAGKEFSVTRGLTWRNVQWHAAGSLHRTHAALTVHLCAAKDGEARGQRYPMVVRRRARGNKPANDAMCAYDLLLAAWREDVRICGEQSALDTPVFRTAAKGGAATAFSTSDVLDIVREIAIAAGEDPSAYGAHSLRIGGATDFRDLFDTSTETGLGEAKRALKARGRWKSDIAYIYARTSLDSSLEASARVGNVSGRDIESAFAGWAEPAA